MNDQTPGADRLPLAGVTVVELAQIVAGPFPVMLLGDLGAEVVKIEAPRRGDRARGTEPIPEYFDTQNRNKRSVEIDLKSERGQEIAHKLLAEADVFLESTKPGRIDSYHLDYDTISESNPSIVYCSITGFGEGSPYQHVPAWDMLMQAMSGVMSITGEADGPPIWSGLPSGDLAASMYALSSILTALYARERGEIDGEYIEISMLDCAISFLTARAGHTFGTGEPYPRMDRHATMAPFGPYGTADDDIVIAAGTDSLWRDLCRAIDRPDMAEDSRFETQANRVTNRDDLVEELDSTLQTRGADEWIERMHASEVPAAPIYDTLTVWDDPHVKQRGLKRRLERDDGSEATVIDNPVRFANLDHSLRRSPPRLGQDTDEVLDELGYSTAEIQAFHEDEVI